MLRLIQVTYGRTYLQDSFPKENHLLADFLYNEILNLEPFFIVTSSRPCPELHLPNGVLFVSGGARNRLVGDIGDQVVEC